jgi:hypothetical protein
LDCLIFAIGVSTGGIQHILLTLDVSVGNFRFALQFLPGTAVAVQGGQQSLHLLYLHSIVKKEHQTGFFTGCPATICTAYMSFLWCFPTLVFARFPPLTHCCIVANLI